MKFWMAVDKLRNGIAPIAGLGVGLGGVGLVLGFPFLIIFIVGLILTAIWVLSLTYYYPFHIEYRAKQKRLNREWEEKHPQYKP